MPELSRYFIRAGIVCFVLSIIVALIEPLGQVLQIGSMYRLSLMPVFWHLLAVGWITQIIIGVSIWMFPRYSKKKPKGPDAVGWATFVLINLGLLIRVVLEPWQPAGAWDTVRQAGLISSAGLQWLGGLGYVLIIWPRVKTKEQMRKQKRKNKSKEPQS